MQIRIEPLFLPYLAEKTKSGAKYNNVDIPRLYSTMLNTIIRIPSMNILQLIFGELFLHSSISTFNILYYFFSNGRYASTLALLISLLSAL